LFFLSLFFLI